MWEQDSLFNEIYSSCCPHYCHGICTVTSKVEEECASYGEHKVDISYHGAWPKNIAIHPISHIYHSLGLTVLSLTLSRT